MSETYISVDIEADGPVPGRYSMLSIGAEIVNPASTKEPHRYKPFYAELKPISDLSVPEALAVSGLDRDRLSTHGEDPGYVMRRFAVWATDHSDRPVFCSFSGWDWGFVYYYLMTYNGASPFGHSAIDMKSFYMGRYRTGWRDTTKSRIAKTYPHLTSGIGPHTHNALDDAREQAKLFARMLGG